MKLRRLTLMFTAVTAIAGALAAPPPAPASAQGSGLCTRARAQVMSCPDGKCPMLAEYSSNTVLLPAGETEGYVIVNDPLSGQQGYIRANLVKSCEVAAWQTRPVIPGATGRAREIYHRGLGMGNNPRAFSRVGDCQSVPQFFLGTFDQPGTYDLGPYANLQALIDHFSGSFGRRNVTVNNGFNVASVLSPIWSDPKQCNPDETPLQCEYRLHKPSFAIVAMETGLAGLRAQDYENYLRQILNFLIEHGTVPILMTKADNIEGRHRINEATVRVADEYGLPLWNFWLAAQALPNHGLLPDRYHLSFARNFFGDARRLRYGWPVRNLTALLALDSVWRGVQ